MRIVRENYPVAELPEDLRADFPQSSTVRVVVEAEAPTTERVLTLDELWAMRRGPFKTSEEVAAEVRRMRDEDD